MNNIKKLRTKLGHDMGKGKPLTQVEFAKLLKTSQMTIHRWENEKCPDYINELAKLALDG